MYNVRGGAQACGDENGARSHACTKIGVCTQQKK